MISNQIKIYSYNGLHLVAKPFIFILLKNCSFGRDKSRSINTFLVFQIVRMFYVPKVKKSGIYNNRFDNSL
jgi:hypothetical protein